MNKEFYMLVLVDEILSLQNNDEFVKKAKLKGKYNQLDDALRFIKPSFFTRKIVFKTPTLNEELEYFIKLFEEHDKIAYFYDSRFRSGELLNRLQNWLLPDKVLWPIPINGNKAELLYFVEEVRRLDAEKATYTDVLKLMKGRGRTRRNWVISPSPMKVIRPKKHNAIYKPKNYQVFVLMEVLADKRIKTHQTGTIDRLWKVLTEEQETEQVWAVSKGLDIDLPHAMKHVQLENECLPVGVPYIQAVTI